MKTITKSALAAAVLGALMLSAAPTTVMAAGGASGAAVKYAKQGQIGEVITNPYRIAPLAAIIRSGGYTLSNVKVRIVPKENGSEIKYDVDRSEVLTHGGIPVFGLYPDYVNTVEVSYTRTDLTGEKKAVNEAYKIYAPPVYTEGNGTVSQKSTMFDTTVALDVILTFATPSTFHGVAKHAIFAGVQRQRRSAPAEQGAQHL